MGYGDFFIAAVLGGVLLVERTPAPPIALACLVFAACFDLLFFVTDELPATVPVALALIASEIARGRFGVGRTRGSRNRWPARMRQSSRWSARNSTRERA